MSALTSWHPFRSLTRRDDPIEDVFRDLFRIGAGEVQAGRRVGRLSRRTEEAPG